MSTTSQVKVSGLSAPGAGARVAGAILTDCAVAIVSAVLLIFSFPDFNLWPVAWLALIPLIVVIARRPAPWRAFLLGWLAGAIFFYGSCHWLTYSMVHYGEIPIWASYLLLFPGALTVGIFPGLFGLVIARVIKRWGLHALLLAPFVWTSLEWARLAVTGQLWNAIGYSQAYQPILIQSARWGGVYFVGFLIVSVNAAIALSILKRAVLTLAISSCLVVGVVILIFAASYSSSRRERSSTQDRPAAMVVALQPNVPMDPVKTAQEMPELIARHMTMSQSALRQLANDGTPRLVIWPESPMNFSYGGDAQFREILGRFARENNTSVLFNSQESAPNGGLYNSAVLANQQGGLTAQYDKIRLLPFGEYVPVPRWLPGASLITAIVGEFTPGTKYTLMPVGDLQAGVFICIESAYPSIARSFTKQGADVLINISNDGYLGPTAVMHQHLANAVFRAVENGRPLLRVTNTGISAYITPGGEVKDATPGFQPAVRTWTITHSDKAETFYTMHGDLFVGINASITLLLFAASFIASIGRHASRAARLGTTENSGAD